MDVHPLPEDSMAYPFRLLLPLALLAGGIGIPAPAGARVVILNLSGGTVAVCQPWIAEPWDPLSVPAFLHQRLLGHGQQASFSVAGGEQGPEVTCVIHQLPGGRRFHVEGLEVRALERLFMPVLEPPGNGRVPPFPGEPTPDLPPLPKNPPFPPIPAKL
jgi:hypothetical protein